MPGKSKKGGGLEVGSSYKMKNSALHMGAKHGSPIQGNYGAPTKYTGHWNDPRQDVGTGAEGEVRHASGQATVQAPIAMKESPTKEGKTRFVDKLKAAGRAVGTSIGGKYGHGGYGGPTLSETVASKYKKFKRGYRRKQASK
tara:strand:+ start:110 stop:535 length:426 start_codon:yes stop_codon:yes gene_type:complete